MRTHRVSSGLRALHRAILPMAIMGLLATACGGGGGGGGGDRDGENTLPVIVELETPLGLQGVRGVGANVDIVYRVRDREFDPTDVEVQYGVDVNRDGTVAEAEFFTATAGPGGSGTTDLGASPGQGTVHIFVWNSLADLPADRYVTQDYVYNQVGRVELDDFGQPKFQHFPGAVVRVRPVADGLPGAWRYSLPFDVNNNNRPSAVLQAVAIPPEGTADVTVNEQVLVDWTATDPDDDPLTIAADWVSVPQGFDPSAMTTAELESLPWGPATAGTLGDGTFDLAATEAGVPHQFGWSSIADAGTVNQWVLLRFRPIDGKLEVGDWAYLPEPVLLDNFTVFTDPDAALPTPLAGTKAVLLRNEQVETVLLVGGSATDGGPGTNFAAFFYPGATQTTKGVIAPIAGGMQEARVGHTATRLLDGRVLITGGASTGGVVSSKAEIYDPATRTFSFLATTMNSARRDHVAVLLTSGDVLLAGGRNGQGLILSSAEVFRAATGTFEPVSAAAEMGDAREGAAAVLLPDGRALVAGGRGDLGALATVEIYDPAQDGFVLTDVGNDLGSAREGLTLTQTLDPVYAAIAAGGMASPPTASLERFDWTTDDFSPSGVSMRTGRAFHQAVLLGDGRILLAGGQTDEAGALTGTADLYDPADDSMDLPNGEMLVPVKDAGTAILERGRPVFFGGLVSAAATTKVQIFTPDGGFNEPPTAQIADMLGAIEPWPFGVRIRWRAVDAEGDPVRIVTQFKIRPSSVDDSASLPDGLKDRWLPATMRAQTVLGEVSSGLTALSSRTDLADPVSDPIDAPDVDAGEHLFVWATEQDVPKGDYDNVFVRIFIYGAEEGTGVESARFSIAKNAPVIARIEAPVTDFGNIVVPFYLQDSDQGQLARLVWEYGIDKNGDGKIVVAEGESWVSLKHSPITMTVDGETVNDAGSTDVVTGSEDPDPNNDYTDPTGIPWGKKHYLIWDSVYDLGSPETPRTDLVLRVVPYDYPAGDPNAENLGIERSISGFTVRRDPNGLALEGWRPLSAGVDPAGVYKFAGVKTDEPIVFTFTQPVEPSSATGQAIQIFKEGSGTQVSGFYHVDNSSGKGIVTFYPQVQEIPARTDILDENAAYSVRVYGYDPTNRSATVVTKLGGDPDDTNDVNLLASSFADKGFKTGTGVLPDAVAPAFTNRAAPAAATNVGVDTDVTLEFSERLMPSSVGPTSFLVVAKAFSGVDSVIPGSFKLSNIVDQSGPGGTLRRYARLTLDPTMTLPPDATEIEVRVNTSLKDLAGNGVASTATTTFTTVAGSQTIEQSLTEEFNDTTNRDADLTTAFWGAADPKNKGAAAGSGTSGKLTGLFDGGNGSDGVLDLTSGNVTLTTSSSKKEWQYQSVNIPAGRTLTIAGTHPATIRVQGGVTINGRVLASGTAGGAAFEYPTSGTNAGAKGGGGGPGGGPGGSVGNYTFRQTAAVNGGHGTAGFGDSAGSSRGLGGGGAITYPPSGIYDYWGGGGGGGAHASAGTDGAHGYTGYGQKGGKGGSSFGSAKLSNGPEAGAGGGAGGASVMAYTYSSWYGAGSGAAGGGGGGYVEFAANGTVTIESSGEVLARGGDGGNSTGTYAWTTVYPGGGGGGAGGTIRLKAGDVVLKGLLDVLGGKGGAPGDSSSYPNPGGAGGDGRILLEKPNFRATLFSGAVTTGGVLVASGGTGTADWRITSDTKINTDSGLGIPGSLPRTSGRIQVKNFGVAANVTVTLEGSKPFVIEATGDVEILGTIIATPNKGSDNQLSIYSSTAGWLFLNFNGGKGVVGGFDGGSTGGSTSQPNTSLDMAKDGVGIDGKEGGSGAGLAGEPTTSPYLQTGSNYTYYFYYYSGGGGGGGGGEAGKEGTTPKMFGAYGGTSGKAGAAVVDPAKLSASAIVGGAGGGSGGNGGYRYLPTSGSSQFYGYGPAAAGGGGGAAIAITAKGDMTLAGAISVKGGDGGSAKQSSSSFYSYWPGAGGAGAGGNVFLQADGELVVPTGGIFAVDASGGKGGVNQYSTTTPYSTGGDGGPGAIVLRSKQPIDLPGNLGSANNGKGTFTGGDYVTTSDGVSKWFDAGAVAPEYVSRTLLHNGGGKLWVMGAQTDVVTGGPDETNTTGWVDVSGGDLSALDGYRWFRFNAELLPVIGSYPEIQSVRIDWRYRK